VKGDLGPGEVGAMSSNARPAGLPHPAIDGRRSRFVGTHRHFEAARRHGRRDIPSVVARRDAVGAWLLPTLRKYVVYPLVRGFDPATGKPDGTPSHDGVAFLWFDTEEICAQRFHRRRGEPISNTAYERRSSVSCFVRAVRSSFRCRARSNNRQVRRNTGADRQRLSNGARRILVTGSGALPDPARTRPFH
jgi:hypothetical protein